MPNSVVSKATAAAFLGLLAPCTSLAQAWLPPKGETYVSLGYQYVNATDHLTATGDRLDRGRMQWQDSMFDLSYAATDRLQVRVAIPLVFSRYTGAFPHPSVNGQSPDDGNWNGTFQDFRAEARFMARTKGLVITPFVSIGVPSHAYLAFGHSAPGKDLKQISAGASFGRLLDPLLANGYAQARLAFTVPEKVLGISHNRSNADLEVGYFVTPALAVRVNGSWQKGFGGWTTLEYPAPTSPAFSHHDQLSRESYFDLGAGVSFSATRSVDLMVTGFKTLHGTNTIKSTGFAVGATFGFSSARLFRRAKEQESMPAPGPPTN